MTTLAPDRVELQLDDGQLPRDAVYAAAFSFIDRCWVRLDRHQDDAGPRISIVLRPKSAGSFDGAALAAELRNELAAQAFRQQLAEAGRDLTEAVIRSAYGSVDSPAIDDLLAGGTSLEDPLGLALRWESESGPKPVTVGEAPATEPEGEQGDVIELRFHHELYGGFAIDEAAKVYGPYAEMDLVREPEAYVVRITSSGDLDERTIAAELANYALGLTVEKGAR